MKELLRWVRLVYQPVRGKLVIIFLFIIASQALGLLFPYLYGKVIDALTARWEWRDILFLIGAAFTVNLARSVVVMYFREAFELEHLDFDVPRRNTDITLRKLLGFSIGQLKNEHSGIRQSVITRGEHSLTSFSYMMLYDVVPLVAQTFVTLGMLLWVDVTFGCVALAGVLCFSGVVLFLVWRMRDDLKTMQDLGDKNGKEYTEILRNLELIKLHAQEERVAGENDERYRVFADIARRTWKRYVRVTAIRNLIVAVSVFVTIGVGARAVQSGTYTVGHFTMLISWSWAVFDRLGSIGHIQRQLLQMYTGIKRYFTMMGIEPDIRVIENPVRPDALRGCIEFRDLTFTYPVRTYVPDEDDEKKVAVTPRTALKGITFRVEAGERVALVGHSGSGKTTLISLLARAYDPTQGSILIDGHDLRTLDLRWYREQLGVVEQDIALFDDTIRRNVLFGLNGRGAQVSEQELEETTRMACLDSFLSRCEKGIDTEIGERGVKVSGGERQRIGIARALIKVPRILVFDEATSHLDAENESLIRDAVNAVSKGRTTLIIAHRLSTVRDANRILVLDDGCLVGSGRHDELLASCEPYQRLIESQVI